MLGLGPWELAAVLLIVLVLFGSKKLPELARGLGKSITNFKSGLNEGQAEEDDATVQDNDAPQKKEVS
ncbi:twin-arginine translocase TatA/TatE family subunit [Candidatus Poribacteria bacterium]|nr:twin-arginine translocase TatA/TatE family subunit [Candidatus Poribacteria bacterium]